MLIRELFESPISDMSHLGDWERNSSFRHEQDRKLVTNPKAIRKIKAMWKYPEEVNFNIILINNAEANRWTEMGSVSREKLQRMFPKTIAEIEPLLKRDEVNIIFTNNKGDQRVPITGWIMAHRFGHALWRNAREEHYYFNQAVRTLGEHLTALMRLYGVRTTLFDRETRYLAQAIGTFKSARDKKLRNAFELVHELFAQYIMTGQITFNDVPKVLKVGRNYRSLQGDEDDLYAANRLLQFDLPYELGKYFETACHHSVGKIFVM